MAWEVPTGKEMWRVHAKDLLPETLAFAPGVGLLAVDGDSFTPIDLATGQPGVPSKHGGGTLRYLTFSADGKRFVASDYNGHEITWGDTASGKVTASQKLHDRIFFADFSRDLKVVVGELYFEPTVVTLAPEPLK
jgi:tricorn protease-like protein